MVTHTCDQLTEVRYEVRCVFVIASWCSSVENVIIIQVSRLKKSWKQPPGVGSVFVWGRSRWFSLSLRAESQTLSQPWSCTRTHTWTQSTPDKERVFIRKRGFPEKCQSLSLLSTRSGRVFISRLFLVTIVFILTSFCEKSTPFVIDTVQIHKRYSEAGTSDAPKLDMNLDNQVHWHAAFYLKNILRKKAQGESKAKIPKLWGRNSATL